MSGTHALAGRCVSRRGEDVTDSPMVGDGVGRAAPVGLAKSPTVSCVRFAQPASTKEPPCTVGTER
jgi:hypothetical protein